MGRKVHPNVFRIGVTRGWDGVWFADREKFKRLLEEDVRIRSFLFKKLSDALLHRIEIERSREELRISIESAKPGIVIGRAGAGIDELTKEIKKRFYAGRRVKLSINVKEVKSPSLSARVVAQQIVGDLQKRMPFRRVMKQAIERVMKANAQGVKISLGGRLNGADIARSETLSQGKTPLHNLRANIDYASIMARTIWGAIGVKVWINRGEVFGQENPESRSRK
jgi:small subunit ribosomal protein S3